MAKPLDPNRPTVPELAPRIRAYYADPEVEGLGGALHIATEDGNLRDCHLEWCRDDALAGGDEEGAALASAMLSMSHRQRRRLASMSFYPWS